MLNIIGDKEVSVAYIVQKKYNVTKEADHNRWVVLMNRTGRTLRILEKFGYVERASMVKGSGYMEREWRVKA